MIDEKEITESEVWRQAYNAALTGTLAGADVVPDEDTVAAECCVHADLALSRYLTGSPR